MVAPPARVGEIGGRVSGIDRRERDPALLGSRAAAHAQTGALAQGRALRWSRRHPLLAGRPPPRRGRPAVVESDPARKEIPSMATERPLIGLAGPIHPDRKAVLEKEARAVVCEAEPEAGLAKMAAEAQGIRFRVRPRCTPTLLAACRPLTAAGRN